MKTLYLDLGMGAAGDMLTAALLELMPERRDEFLRLMNGLGLRGVTVEAEPSVKCGITGTHVDVQVNGEHEQSLDVDDHVAAADMPERGRVTDATEQRPHDHDGHHHRHGHPGEAPDEGDADHHHHSHTSYPHIVELISTLAIGDRARTDAIAVYSLLADAESAVHGMPVDQVHFHEVGELDAIADIVGCSVLMSWLEPRRVLASSLNVGSGKVRCAHGIVPVPAPATERLLRGIPVYGGTIRGELCTPTGAALIKHFVDEFVATMPPMTVTAAGYGMGTKDFEAANCVRALLGEAADPDAGKQSPADANPVTDDTDGPGAGDAIRPATGGSDQAGATVTDVDDVDVTTTGSTDEVVELSCNLDDMTGEAIAYAQQKLFAAGAVEVFTTAVSMKKGRPGVLLTCLCPTVVKDVVVRTMFAHTTTIGVREHICHRYTLERSEQTVETRFGPVHVKVAAGYGVERRKPEHEDLAAIAEREQISLEEVRRAVP